MHEEMNIFIWSHKGVWDHKRSEKILAETNLV